MVSPLLPATVSLHADCPRIRRPDGLLGFRLCCAVSGYFRALGVGFPFREMLG